MKAGFATTATPAVCKQTRIARTTARNRLFRFALAPLALAAAISLPGLTLAAPAADRVPNEDCLDCHTDPTLTKKVKGKDVPIPLFQTNLYARSVHAKLACVDCHAGIKEAVHDSNPPPAQCVNCHDDTLASIRNGGAKAAARHKQAQEEYITSIHGLSRTMGESPAATCADCHGTHGILRVNDPESPVFKFNLTFTCAACHSNPGLTQEYRMKYPEAAKQYSESIHGQALMSRGLVAAPTCNDCHGVHDIKRSQDRSSHVHRSNISSMCSKCHLGVEKVYSQSVHGRLLLEGDKRAPICTDCHNAHEIERAHTGHFKSISDRRCGQCHEESLVHYRETYHGKAMALGRPNVAPDVAACYDCHGHHDVLPASDPDSHLSPNNIVATCDKCHSGATARFAGYQPHANHLDRENYPVLFGVFVAMTALLAGVFTFFGAHTILWLWRAGRIYLHDSKSYRTTKEHGQRGEEWFTRFTPYERFLHILVVTSFLLLVITGMPLKFYDAKWAKVMFDMIGGAQVARVLHHFGALVTFLYFGLHLASLAVKAWKGRGRLRDPASGKLRVKRLWPVLFGPDSMIPSLQDLGDFVAHVKWFIGKGAKPQFDRWTYWEKFDYFAVFWGVFIIGLSGLVLWFPLFFTSFLPGWVINIAQIVHSDEALLAAGFIFAVHFFNTHFRLERFPMDTVIFSGRISRNEMLHERRRWYDRLVAENRLDHYRVRDEWERWKPIARSFGYTFFGIGMVLLILIIYAMATRLAH